VPATGVLQGRERDRELADPRGARAVVENNYGYQDPFGLAGIALGRGGLYLGVLGGIVALRDG